MKPQTNKKHALSAALLLLSAGNLAAQTQDTTYSYQYDAMGNLKQVTDPLGQVTNQSYDALNRLVQQLQPAPTAGGARPTINYAYDGQDQLISVTDPRSLVTSYTVDGLGNQTGLSSPDTGATTKTYDAMGNVLTSTDARGKTTQYTYDALNRLKLITYPSGTATTLEYDGGPVGAANALGRLTKITDESGQTSYTYDQQGRLTTKVQTVGSGTATGSFTLTQTFGTSGSATGKLLRLTYPSGHQIEFGYDTSGRPNSLTLIPSGQGSPIPLLNTIGYAPFGGPTSWTWGNSSGTDNNTYARGTDLNGRITSYPLGHALSKGLYRSVGYDAASRINALPHSGSGTPASFDQTFGYDGLDRLTSFTGSASNQSWQYDATGNRTQATLGSNTYANSIAAASNRLASAAGPSPAKTYTYDAAGNRTGDGAATYSYSDRGRLQSVTTAAGTVTYLYNGLGQRVRKSGPASLVPSGRIDYVYDEQGHLLGEYDATGAALQETVYLNDLPVAVLTPGLSDNLIVTDNTAATTSVAGTWSTSTATEGYYGSNYRSHAAASNSDSFIWQIPLPQAGLYHLYARWPAGADRATNAPYTITSAGGNSTVAVNQQNNNNTWVQLGTYRFSGTTAKVALGVSGTGSVMADAVMALPATGAIADNTDATSSAVGTWSGSTSVGGYYGSNYQAHAPASNNDRFSWQLTLPAAGTYNLYARWTTNSNRATNAPYTITHASGSSTVTVNQQNDNNTWVALGTYTFNGTEANVTLGVASTGYVIADAVMAVAPVSATPGVKAQVNYVYADHLNTPRVITRASDNQMVWRWDQADPFGMALPDENPSGVGTFTYNPRFPGQVFDKETNLHYNYFRDYDPQTGRYIQSDPIGLAGGINTYAYVANQPTRYTDPLGLCPWCIIPALPYIPELAIIGATWWAMKPPKDAYDPNGAKAPGKPGEAEGFCEPKRGPKWGRSPNGRGNGWVDNDGNVWVPTGPDSGSTGDAHGGPHWDVQKPGGGYDNVYPGGKKR